MESNFYRFEIGDCRCISVSDGGHDYRLGKMFSNVPIEQVVQALTQQNLPADHLFTPYTCLFVDTGANRILVDVTYSPR